VQSPGERAEESSNASASPLVLVVEDDPGVRRLVRSMLRSCGYRVLEAANGSEGLAQLTRHRDSIELVVSDVVMSDINGPELAARMKAVGSAAPVLLMSGYGDRTLWNRGLTDDTMRVLRKPFTLAELSERVAELLGSQGAR
jgi:two-component system, cell cycle sensor histidine kinase and response regulator CckA